MDLELAGKAALITGASKGIGRAAAEGLAAEGCNLILVLRTAADLAAAKVAITEHSTVQIDTVAADLSQSSTVERLAKDFPAIDILVNNAGAIPGGSLLDVDLLCAHEAKGLRRHHQCHRHAAQTHDPEYICGVAGNAALTAFSQSLGSVNVRDSVRVISLNPGPVETERLVNLMKKKAKDRTGNADNCRALFKPLPFGRACAPDEVGAMIAFLASDRCSYNSGSVVTIDAGLSARTFSF